MAARTPGVQARSGVHPHWGNYADGGVSTPANGTLPNQPSNPLANPEFAKLELGDQANATTTDVGPYWCADPGTVSGGDAIWLALGPSAHVALAGDLALIIGQYNVTLDVDTSAARAITLPDPSTLPAGWGFWVKDVAGLAGTNPITLERTGAEDIEGLASDYLLQSNFGVWRIETDGTDWWLK